LIFLVNAWAAALWLWHKEKKPIAKHVIGLVILLVLMNVTGAWKKQRWNATDAKINVLAVQANIGNLEKVYAEQGRGYQAAITSRFATLTQQGLQENTDTDLVIWPETAFPDFPDHPERSLSNLDLISQVTEPK